MNPSTMNLARRSSRATWRITSGFKYFSAVLATGIPRSQSLNRSEPSGRRQRPVRRGSETLGRSGLPSRRDRSTTVVLGHFRFLDLGDQPADQRLGRLPLGLGLKIGADTVPKHWDGHPSNIIQRNTEPAVERRHRLAAEDQVL